MNNLIDSINANKTTNSGEKINAAKFKGSELETDILIIGSGAGGGVSAEIFSNAGFKVLIVEEGPYKTARDFKMLEKEAYPQLYQEAAGRKTLDKAISILQGRSVGGSTTVNWTSSFRTPPKTLAHWQKEWGLDSYTEQQLAPWFAKMEKRLNIEPWAVPLNSNNSFIKEGADKLGWATKIIARNVKGCANLGYCGMGCPLNAKQSMLVTTIPSAIQNGATLLYQARVNQLTINRQERVVGCNVSPMNDQGQVVSSKSIRIKAKHTILSAGAIGSPAVLLRTKVPDPYALIGKRTFLHPVVVTASIMKQKVNAFSGAPQSIYSDQFLWPNDKNIGFKIEAAPLHPLLVSTVLTNFGQQHADLMEKFPYIQGSLALLRDGFNEDSIGGQVVLDDYGYPKLDYPISDYVWNGARKALLAMSELGFASGAQSVMPLHRDASSYKSWSKTQQAIKGFSMAELKALVFSAHVMGGNPMGTEASMSVVDENGKFRQLDGLYIFDGSIFPTSIGANPQLSIYGIVARLAKKLSQKLAGIDGNVSA